MCLLLDVMCSKTKSKSRTGARTSRKQKCQECTTRRITREELSQMYLPPGPMPMHMPTMNQNQPGYNYGYGYSYGDWAAWEDSYPAMISNKQWKEHTRTVHNTYDSAQENGKKMGEMKSEMASEIKEAQKSIEETHASVNGTASQVKDMRDAINLTHVAVQEAHLAVEKTQNAINDKHAEHMSKQEVCIADVARVRQLLEEEAKNREETRRMQEMIQYAQSQGLLPQTQTQLDGVREQRSQSSRSTSPATSTGSHKTRGEADKRRQWERERERLEREHQARYKEAMREIASTRQRLQEEQERWSRAEGELEYLRRRDSYFHHPRFQGAYYDDVVETPPYNTYSYAEYGVGGGAGHRGPRGQLPRRTQPKCANVRSWDY